MTLLRPEIPMTPSRIHPRVAATLCALATGAATSCDPGPERVHLATAHQMGPVAYRDPAGGISPDGRLLAYTQGRELLVRDLATDEVRSLGLAPSQLRYITWHPDSDRLLVHERSFNRRRQAWFVYDLESGAKETMWGTGYATELPPPSTLLELGWAPDGQSLVGVVRNAQVSRVWRIRADGTSGEVVAESLRLSYPVVSPTGEVACIERYGGTQHLRYPCAEPRVHWLDGQQPYGHVAFSRDGAELYYAAPNDDGVLELWSRPVGGGKARQLAVAERDAYGPAVTADGNIVYRSQHYMVSLSAVPPAGGTPRRITTFQSETPTWSPDGTEVSFTFGRWRVATDDVLYPDIDQHIGIVDATSPSPKSAPDRIVRGSWSEDQGMHWSPNGRWITYHSHIGGTDDIYLIPADDPSDPHIISVEGHETGWPRWSPDGRWIVFPSYTRDAAGARKSFLYVIAVDQETGETLPQRAVDLGDFRHDALQAEWTPDSEGLVFEAAEGAGRKALYRVPRQGGTPERFHEWASDQVHSGIAVSPDGAWVAYIGPDSAGFFQVYRVPPGGGEAEQITADPTRKTQPAYDPTGKWLAYTVFSYEARFWRLGD